jgi:hypothetical protein
MEENDRKHASGNHERGEFRAFEDVQPPVAVKAD